MARDRLSTLGIRDQALEALQHHVADELRSSVFQRDPDYIREHLPTIGQVVSRYFATEVRGLEHVPTDGPFLLVSNHSGGFLMPDVWALSSALYGAFGDDRPLYALMLDFAFAIPGFGEALRKLGAIPASMTNAEHALALGAGVMAYPGGDREAYRPWTERNRIEFHDHTGFVRLALRLGVPVIPAVSHGSHDSLIVVARGDRLGRALGLDRLRIGVFPFTVGVPFGLAPVFLPNMPLPTKILIEVLEPVDWSAHGPDDADDHDVLRACYHEITDTMQHALDRLAAEMPHPLATRLATAAGLVRPTARPPDIT